MGPSTASFDIQASDVIIPQKSVEKSKIQIMKEKFDEQFFTEIEKE